MENGSAQLRVSIKDLREIKNYALDVFNLDLPRGLSPSELQVFLVMKGFSKWAEKHDLSIDVVTKDRR